MKRKAVLGIIALLLMVLTFTGVSYALRIPSASQAAQPAVAEVSAGVARRGDLIIFASGTGQLVAQNETALQFDDQGTVVALWVNVGDEVSAGDVLAQLQVDKSEAQLTAAIAKAALALVKNQQAFDTLYAEAEIAAAQALVNVEQAQQALDALQNNDLAIAQAMQAVAEAEEAIQDAEMQLYIYNSSPSEADIYTAYASLLFKEKQFNELKEQVAQLEYELKTAPNKDARLRISGQLNRAKAQMYDQQIVYEQALYRYNTIDAPADPVDVNLAQAQLEAAQAQLVQAQLDLQTAQAGASDGEIALAEAQLSAAQAEWERWKDGPDPEDILLAKTSLETAQLNLQLAEEASLVVDLVAPMNGTVMAIDGTVNQSVDGDTILTLADTSQPLVEVFLDETDFQSVRVGNRVEVIFDALPDTTFSGVLTSVSPALESTFGAQSITALALLDPITQALPIGLNASVDVIAGGVTNVVLVPVEALQKTDAGVYVVYVQVNGTFKPRNVTVGLIDFTSAEITSGLEAGEVVAIGNIGNELLGE